MRSHFTRTFRAAVLTLLFTVTLIPLGAAPRTRDEGKPPLRDQIARIVRMIQGMFSAPATNADSLTTPRP